MNVLAQLRQLFDKALRTLLTDPATLTEHLLHTAGMG